MRAVDSADNMVRETANLDSENWPERLSINKGRYIQVKNYKDGTLDWIIVVVMPSAEIEDYVRTGTTITLQSSSCLRLASSCPWYALR